MTWLYLLPLSAFGTLVELQGDTVDAITRTRRLRSIREDVTEMRITFGAANLGATHQERTVVVLADRVAVAGA